MMRKLALLGALAMTSAVALPSRAATVKLKVATAAAPESPWGQVFKTWRKAVEQKTASAVSFDFYYNSTQGSEPTLVDKMKAGQLDGAAVTSVGLGKIDKRLLVLEAPGLVRSWKTVDAVRGAMGADFEKMLEGRKVTLVSWGDVGLSRVLSNGFAVRAPGDTKGHHPWVPPDDPNTKAMWGKVGGAPWVADVMSVLPDIDNGKIDCLETSALVGEMLQWNAKFDHGIDRTDSIVVGAVVLSTDSLDRLPADARAAVIETGKAMATSASGLKARIRNEDDAAWTRFRSRSGVKIHAPSTDEAKLWDAAFKAARDQLKAGTFDAAFLAKIEGIAAANP